MIVNSLTSIGVSFIIAFYFSWKLTLVILCFLPLIGLSGVFQAKMLTGFANEDKKSMEAAGRVSSPSVTTSHQNSDGSEFLVVKIGVTCLPQVSSEALANIRTIAGLAKESSFVELYEQKLELPYKSAKKKANIYGLCFGFAQCVIFMAYAASFRYGGFLVSSEGLPYMFVFRLAKIVLFDVFSSVM